MGGGGSTRRITVEEDESSGVVKISDSVVRRLKGEIDTEPAPQVPQETPLAPALSSISDEEKEREIQEIETYYKEKLKAAELKNSELYQTTTDQFAQAVQEVESKFLKTTASPVCQSLQEEVLKCYQANPNQTLMCSAQVRAFTECVEKARQTAVTAKQG